MNKFILSLIVFCFGLAACSVKQGAVASHPPVLNEGMKVSVLSHFGTLRVDSISAFFWPKQWSEAQMEKNVEIINRDAQKLDGFSKQTIPIVKIQIPALWAQFKDQDQCIAKFVDPTKVTDPDLIQETDVISDWKTVADDEKPALKKCQDNQDQRVALRAVVDANTAQQNPLIGEINTLLDPKYPDVIENSLSIQSQGSEVSIKKTTRAGTHESVVAVDVTLADFLRDQNTQSTTKGTVSKASYNEREGLLTFQVPEFNKDGTATGKIYSFSLYRSDNSYTDVVTGTEYAVFKGTVDLMKNSKSIRSGKAQIAGFLSH
jgi:hypothetical protein